MLTVMKVIYQSNYVFNVALFLYEIKFIKLRMCLAFNMDVATLKLFLSNFVLIQETFPFIDLFKHKNINYAINFHCHHPETSVSMQKLFYKNEILIANLKSNHNATYKIPFSYRKLGVVLNTSCEGWQKGFQLINKEDVFKSPFTWLIITENFTSTVNSLSHYPIEVDSDVTIIYKTDRKFCQLYEVYNTGFFTGGRFIIKKIGYWDSKLSIKKQSRTDLSGVTLKCTVVITERVTNETFEEYVERSKLSKSDTLHKLKYFTLLKYLRDMYSINYDLLRTNSWGYLRNGSFDGMIGTLQRQEADIGGSPIFFRIERAKVIDSTAEVWQTRPVFILRHPKHQGGYFTIFTRPLTNEVWCCVLALLIISGAFLCAMVKIKALELAGDDADSSLSLAFLTIWSAICQQGTTISRSSTSIKIQIFVTFLFTLTIYQYYNATVVSTLLRDPPKNIRTPQDLLRSNLKTGVHDVLYNKDFFTRTTDPIALEMYKKKIVTPTEYNFFDLEHGMKLVKKGGFAFLVDNTIAYGMMKNTFNENQLCEAHEIALYPPQKTVAIVKKKSPYREHFSFGLRKMFESGLMHRIRSVWDERKPACVRTPDTSQISVSVREFSTALVVLACGMVAAVAVLACEIAAYKMSVFKGGFRQTIWEASKNFQRKKRGTLGNEGKLFTKSK